MRVLALVAVAAALAGCRVLTSGLSGSAAAPQNRDATFGLDATATIVPDGGSAMVDVGEPPGLVGAPILVGCSDGTREGFRSVRDWPDIAGCAGAFDKMGVIGTPDLLPTCERQAGDTSANLAGTDCSAADLCAQDWHLCRDGVDVALHSPTAGCEGCVRPGEPRFFLVASGASPLGLCTPDPAETNDLHGCGGLGQSESDGCSPLTRRMGFADCLTASEGWSCGGDVDHLREAAVVTKPGSRFGGALCCKD